MNLIEAIVEHGRLKLLKHLPLKEHQHVWVMILSGAEEPTGHQMTELAAQSPSFQFLAASAEDQYSLQDGQPV